MKLGILVFLSYLPCESVCNTKIENPTRNTDAQWKSTMPEKTELSPQQLTSDDLNLALEEESNNEYNLILKFNICYTLMFVARATSRELPV